MAGGDETVALLTRQLISIISGFDETSEHMPKIVDFAFSHIFSPNNYYTAERKQVVDTIDKLSEKYKFHGYVRQADDLKEYADKFLDSMHFKGDLDVRVAILQLFLELSESPTTQFAQNPSLLDRKYAKPDDIVDWGTYLKDTRVNLKESYTESLSDWSETLSDISFDQPETSTQNDEVDFHPLPVKEAISAVDIHKEGKYAAEWLRNEIQCDWWNKEHVIANPQSTFDDARVGIVWAKFVDFLTIGLNKNSVSILSEYKILREVLWLFFVPHSCSSFVYENDKLLPQKNIGISSVRPETLQSFLMLFVPYYEYMHTFSTFKESLHGEYFITGIPDTYRSYNTSIEEIIQPIFTRIQEIEDSVRKQEGIYTLLSVAKSLQPFLRPLQQLHQIHNEVMKNTQLDTAYLNATHLLSRLYYELLNSTAKNDQNLYLTLYLKSLYKYFTIIEIWLSQDVLEDLTDEFVIVDKNPESLIRRSAQSESRSKQGSEDWQMEYVLRKLDPLSKMDGMLNIITTKVLQIGKNTHLLRLLGKLHLVSDECGHFKESLHEEFVETVLGEAANYIRSADDCVEEESHESVEAQPTVICPEVKASESGLDTIENILDTSDGFLSTVFRQYLFPEAPKMQKSQDNLHERINQKINKLFPAKQIVERSFVEILRKRYSVPGLMVKNLLVNQYKLKNYISFIKHVYLFEDDIIFPFYKKIFAQFDAQQTWGNFFWLTSLLQDLLMDVYPDLYESCHVDVAPNWKLCTNPIQACDLISVHFKLEWPVNIIIRTDHMKKYHEVFQYILKLKWALNTLNRLSFNVLESRKATSKKSPLLRKRIRQLQLMRFWLTNDLCSVQHYVLGHLFTNLWTKFDRNIEESYDIESLLKSHTQFVDVIYTFCKKLRDFKSTEYGFTKLLSLVTAVRLMWHDVYEIDDQILKQCGIDYLKCHQFLKPIIEVDILF